MNFLREGVFCRDPLRALARAIARSHSTDLEFQSHPSRSRWLTRGLYRSLRARGSPAELTSREGGRSSTGWITVGAGVNSGVAKSTATGRFIAGERVCDGRVAVKARRRIIRTRLTSHALVARITRKIEKAHRRGGRECRGGVVVGVLWRVVETHARRPPFGRPRTRGGAPDSLVDPAIPADPAWVPPNRCVGREIPASRPVRHGLRGSRTRAATHRYCRSTRSVPPR